MQKDFNRQDLTKLRIISIIGSALYALWIFFDFIFINPNMWGYCYKIRFGIPAILLPAYFLPRHIVIPWVHIWFPFTYALAFGALLPLMFHTKYMELYLVCSFIIPLVAGPVNSHNIKSYLFYPFFFAIFCYMQWDNISALEPGQKYFILFYSLTILVMLGMIVHFNYLNRMYRLSLENKLRDSLEDKSSLVRVLTHDISNVLMVMGMNFSIVKMYFKDKELKKHLARSLDLIERSTVSMGEIIDKVVEMESIEGGKKELQLGNENIYEITHTAVDFLTDRYSQKDVELIINHNDLDWVEVNIDASVFRYNILNNLLTNALKFSSTGSKVEVNFTRQDHYILVEIRDYGIGIPKDMYDSIFDPSKKTTLNGTSGESGTGFGMPLAHSCTQKMNGLLRFESKEENESPEDHGTSFFICFPISNNSNKIAA